MVKPLRQHLEVNRRGIRGGIAQRPPVARVELLVTRGEDLFLCDGPVGLVRALLLLLVLVKPLLCLLLRTASVLLRLLLRLMQRLLLRLL